MNRNTSKIFLHFSFAMTQCKNIKIFFSYFNQRFASLDYFKTRTSELKLDTRKVFSEDFMCWTIWTVHGHPNILSKNVTIQPPSYYEKNKLYLIVLDKPP